MTFYYNDTKLHMNKPKKISIWLLWGFAETRLYTLLCRSVGRSVGPSVRHIFEFRAVFALLPLPIRPRLDCRVSGLVDSRLTSEPHTKKMMMKSYKSLNLLRLISSLSKSHKPDNLLRIYQSTIRSIFEYSSLCVLNAAECHIEKLQVVQNQALRLILGTPSYVARKDLHDCAGIPTIKDHLTNFARERLKSMQSTSPLIARTIDNFKKVQHIRENASTLDVLGY